VSVYKAINNVQSALAKTGISKDRTNTQGSGYKFRGIDDVYNAIAPLLAEHGLCILPRMIGRECVERQSQKGNALFYVTVDAEFDFVCAEDGSKHTVRTYGEAMDSGDKATNKAMSAAYKYAAFQTFAIPTEGDNDADSHTHEVAPKSAKSVPQDAWDNCDTDTKTWLTDIATNAKVLLGRGDVAGAYDEIESHKLEIENKTAFWYLFDSKQRSALTKEANQRKAK